MDINDLTIGQAKELAAMFSGKCAEQPAPQSTEAQYVVVTTDKRGVVFGLTYDQHVS